MTITGQNGATVEVDTYQHTDDDQPEMTLIVDTCRGDPKVRIAFDAKQTAALLHALCAAELQLFVKVR